MSSKYLSYVLILLLFVFNSCEKEVSVSPPDLPPPDGSVFINTVPDSFKIIMEGKDRLRLTPDSIRWLETGIYNFTLRKDHFLDSTFTLDVTEGEKSFITIDYTINPKFRGSLFIESNPPDAKIFLNDSNTALITPAEINNLMPGVYKITLKKEDFSDYTFYKDVNSGKTTKYKPTLIDTTIWDYFNTSNSVIAADNLSSITIDNDDNLWIGSREGLLKYNGLVWKVFFPGTSLLPHPVVLFVQTDEKNRVWALTAGGMAIFQNDEVPLRFTSSGSRTAMATGFGTDSVSTTIVKSGSPYYFATDIGMGIASEAGNLSFRFNFTTIQGTTNRLTVFEKLDQNTLLIGTAESGLVIYKGEGEIQVLNRGNSIIPGNSISAMFKSSEGVWIGHLPGSGTGGGLSLFDGSKFYVYSLGVPPPLINCIFVNSNGIKFVGTNIGLFIFDEFENRILINEESSGLPIKNISGITEDSSGKIWITTAGSGLFKLKKIPF